MTDLSPLGRMAQTWGHYHDRQRPRWGRRIAAALLCLALSAMAVHVAHKALGQAVFDRQEMEQ